MGAIAELVTRAATYVTGGRLSNPPLWLRMLLGGGTQTDSGMNVDEDTALKYTAVWAAVNIISGAVGMLPCVVYRRLERGKERASKHPAYRLLHDRPNPHMDAQVFRETLQAHVLLWGNAYAEIERDGAGRPLNIWPLLPNRTEPKLVKGTHKLYYEVTLAEGGTIPLPADNVMHIRGLGFDGYKGYSVIGYHRESVGLGLATQKFGAKFFGNGARPGGVLEHPGTISEKAAKNLRESWNEIHQGLDNAHRVAILEEGMKWHEIGMPLEDAQFIETQKFGISNVARMFLVPPHMLADLDRATFSNIEDQGLDFVTYTLGRWLKKWEHESGEKLFREDEKATMLAEFLTAAMLRGNAAARWATYEIGRSTGILSKNDVREFENMNPIAGGDDYTSLAELQASSGQKVDDGVKSGGSGSGGKNQSAIQRQRVADAFRPVLADAIGRMVRKECNDARRATSKKGGMDVWADQYYGDTAFVASFRSAIIPGVDGVADAIWSTLSDRQLDAPGLLAVSELTAIVSRKHSESAKAALMLAFAEDGDMKDLSALESLADSEARTIIESLTQLLCAHAKETYHAEKHAESADTAA